MTPRFSWFYSWSRRSYVAVDSSGCLVAQSPNLATCLRLATQATTEGMPNHDN